MKKKQLPQADEALPAITIPSAEVEKMTALDFLYGHGRLPRWSDSPPAWEYRGWLLPYVIGTYAALEAQGIQGDRYRYYLDINMDGLLKPLAEAPIPRMNFCGEGHNQTSAVYNHLVKCVEIAEDDYSSWSGLRAFFDWLGYGLGFHREKSNLKAKTQEALYRTFQVHLFIQHPRRNAAL